MVVIKSFFKSVKLAMMYQLLIYICFQMTAVSSNVKDSEKISVLYTISYTINDSIYVLPAVLEYCDKKSTFVLTDSLAPNNKCLSPLNELYPFKTVVRDFSKEKLLVITKENALLKELTWKEIHWDIKDEFRTIGDYFCQLAIAECNNKVYWVWFTEDIPVSAGPGFLFGLPGLIINAEIQNETFKIAVNEIK